MIAHIIARLFKSRLRPCEQDPHSRSGWTDQ